MPCSISSDLECFHSETAKCLNVCLMCIYPPKGGGGWVFPKTDLEFLVFSRPQPALTMGEEPNHAWPLTEVAKDGTFGSSSLRTQTEGSINLTFELTPDQPLAIARKVRVQSFHVGCVV